MLLVLKVKSLSLESQSFAICLTLVHYIGFEGQKLSFEGQTFALVSVLKVKV